MATTYESGTAVLNGYYLNASRWSVTPVAHDGERLPAGAGRWMRIPTAAALALVPVLGAAFLVFLPLIGFLVTLHAIASLVVSAIHGSATELAATVSPGWLPGEVHFTGKAGGEVRGGGEGADGPRRRARGARRGDCAAAAPGIEVLADSSRSSRSARSRSRRRDGGPRIPASRWGNPPARRVFTERGPRWCDVRARPQRLPKDCGGPGAG